MTSPTIESPGSAKPHKEHDPNDYRMSLGDHLEELRRRLIYAVVGFVVVLAFTLFYCKEVTGWFCRPLIDVFIARNLNPQLFYAELGDGFMVPINIAMIVAIAIASPWIVYQFWQFIAAGLYPHERKYITRYVPLSVGLLIAGMVFVYVLILPWSVEFFVDFGSDIPIPEHAPLVIPTTQGTAAAAPAIPTFNGDPEPWKDGVPWINSMQSRMKVRINGHTRVIPFGPENLVAPHITLPDYIDLVVGMLVTFGLSFQLPLVVLALERIGIVTLKGLGAARRYVYFALVILAAAITPGDVVTSTVALMLPLCALFELGVALARWGRKKPVEASGR